MGESLFHEVRLHEPRGDHALFYGWPANGPMRLRERYRPYACRSCGKIDPRDAADAGFDEDVLARPPRVDAFCTRDLQYVVSDAGLKVLNDCLPRLVRSWRIGDRPWSFVFPTKVVLPGPAAGPDRSVPPAFGSGRKRCKACGRWEELTLDFGRVRLTARQRLCGYWVEGDLACPNVAWVCDGEARAALLRHRVAGLTVQKDMFGPTAPGWVRFRKRLDDPNSPLRQIIGPD